MGTSDIVIGAAFGACAIALYALTLGFRNITVALSPTVFPRFVSLGLFFLSVILIAQGVRKRTTGRTAVVSPEKAHTKLDRWFFLRFGLFTVNSLLYIVLLEPIGYVIATPPCIACTMLIFGERRWQRIFLISISSTAILYAVFRGIFRVPLPRSFLW